MIRRRFNPREPRLTSRRWCLLCKGWRTFTFNPRLHHSACKCGNVLMAVSFEPRDEDHALEIMQTIARHNHDKPAKAHKASQVRKDKRRER